MITLLIIVCILIYLAYGMYLCIQINNYKMDEWHWVIKVVFVLFYPIWLFISLVLNTFFD
jgi:hypothetical protein